MAVKVESMKGGNRGREGEVKREGRHGSLMVSATHLGSPGPNLSSGRWKTLNSHNTFLHPRV